MKIVFFTYSIVFWLETAVRHILCEDSNIRKTHALSLMVGIINLLVFIMRSMEWYVLP
jgi:hypothetical protein